MAKRLATDAKIALRNAGYVVVETSTNLLVFVGSENEPSEWAELARFPIVDGCVNNEPLKTFLSDKPR